MYSSDSTGRVRVDHQVVEGSGGAVPERLVYISIGVKDENESKMKTKNRQRVSQQLGGKGRISLQETSLESGSRENSPLRVARGRRCQIRVHSEQPKGAPAHYCRNAMAPFPWFPLKT
jgi:hypothetical protein